MACVFASLIIMLILQLVLIFADLGYGAPRNTIVTTAFFLAALVVSTGVFLMVDMAVGMFEPIQVSNVPFQRALAELQR